ncbi:MAG: anti-sigma factor [Solirubrobacteraceae bacterium]
MSRTDGMGRDPHCGDDVAAYALGALDGAELDEFRAHLASCSICRDELASFESVVETLPLSSTRHRAPVDLRRRVMRAVEDEARAAAPAPSPRRRTPGRWNLRPALAFAAAAVIAVAVVIGVSSGGSSPSRIIHAQVTGPGRAELRLNGGHAELIVNGLPAPPSGHIYEVWLKRGSSAPSPTKALFSVTASGQGDVDVPGNLKGVSLVMVTPEPAGGSTVPTHSPVISASLA